MWVQLLVILSTTTAGLQSHQCKLKQANYEKMSFLADVQWHRSRGAWGTGPFCNVLWTLVPAPSSVSKTVLDPIRKSVCWCWMPYLLKGNLCLRSKGRSLTRFIALESTKWPTAKVITSFICCRLHVPHIKKCGTKPYKALECAL